MMRTPPALVSAASASLPSARTCVEEPGAERDPALHDEDGDGRQADARPERRRERDGGEAVEHRLGGERLVVAGAARPGSSRRR